MEEWMCWLILTMRKHRLSQLDSRINTVLWCETVTIRKILSRFIPVPQSNILTSITKKKKPWIWNCSELTLCIVTRHDSIYYLWIVSQCWLQYPGNYNHSATYGVEIEPIKTRRKDKIQQNFNKIVAQAFKAKSHLICLQIWLTRLTLRFAR